MFCAGCPKQKKLRKKKYTRKVDEVLFAILFLLNDKNK